MLAYYLLLVLAPFWQYSRLPQFGESLTLIKLVGVLAFLAALASLVVRPRPLQLFRWAESRLFFLLTTIAFVSAAALSLRGWAYSPLLSYVSVAAFLFITLVFVDSIPRMQRACCVIALSLLVASVYVFTAYFRWGADRPGGIFGDANYFSLAAICFLPAALKLAPTVQSLQKWTLAIASLAMIAAILLGASRGGLLSLACCAAYFVAQSQHRVALAAGMAFAAVPLITLLPQTGFDRFAEQSYGAQVSTDARLNLLKAGWSMVEQHPLTGVGLGNFKPLSGVYEEAIVEEQIGHNTYLEIAAELGIPALIVFVLLLWHAWRSARLTAAYFQEAGEFQAEGIARGFEIGIACFALGAAFLSAEYCKQFWMLIFLTAALKRVAHLHATETQQPAGVTDALEVAA
jgi:O-antigen ligase